MLTIAGELCAQTKGSQQTVVYWYQCILRLSTIYNYAVDIVSLWCQIAHASVTVIQSLNPDLVEATPMSE